MPRGRGRQGSIGRDGAAQSRRLVKIGALTESWGPTPAIVGLRDGLQELGYRENKDFVIGVRFTQGNFAELPAAARDLVRRGVDVIVTTGGDNAAKAAQMATTSDPDRLHGRERPGRRGTGEELGAPGGNITGVADLESSSCRSDMEIFRELVPGLKRVLVRLRRDERGRGRATAGAPRRRAAARSHAGGKAGADGRRGASGDQRTQEE